MHTPTHPHACAAVFLASHDNLPRDHIAPALSLSGAPHSLYTLARVLRAAKLMDEMAAIDAINAAHPAVVAQAA